MSQEYIDPEILADFFVEAKEHLETIEPNLLELEKNPHNLGLLNEIFRPMHSLKGASGFLGLNKINGLAHKAENILDELRQGVMAVTSGIMDVILSATDALRTIVDNLERSGTEGDVDTAPIIARIESILAGEEGAAAPQHEAEQAAREDEEVPMEDDPTLTAPSFEAVDADEPAEVGEAFDAMMADAPNDVQTPAQASASGPLTVRWQELRSVVSPNFDATPYALTIVGEGHLTDFLEEAREIVSDLNHGLVVLEKNPDGSGELINDIFRYFHNIKGNSGIIGYKELNALTHEAETLLNRVRKGEIGITRGLIDLLLAVVDQLEELLARIDTDSGKAQPLDTTAMAAVLQRSGEVGDLSVPAEYLQFTSLDGAGEPQAAPTDETGPVTEDLDDAGASAMEASEVPAEPSVPAEDPVPAEEPVPAAPDLSASGYDPEDVAIFEQTVQQQINNFELAMDLLRTDASQRDVVDGLYRSLTTLQNSSGYMGLAEVKNYAERTAGLVDQARKSDVGFELMLDILSQELSILKDMILKEVGLITGKDPAAAPKAEAAPAPKPEPKSEPKPEPKAVPKPAPKPEPKPEPKAAASSGETKAAPKPAPKPAPKAAPAPASMPAGPANPPPTAAQAAFEAGQPPQKGATTIRVDHEKLDHLMNLIGELIINRNRYSMIARALAEGQENVGDVAQQLTETTYAMARISDDLQDTIMKVRMVPVHTVFSRFPRLVRDLSRKSGKQVELITEGEETELDKSVGEEIGDPLVHLIRNSLDHGLEPEEERIAAGKSPKGHVWLRAYHKGNSVAIEVEDDGRGIDPEKMRQVGVKKGLCTVEEAKLLDDRQAVDLIFAPGFSSAEKITDVSGRGVGMDVVKTNIKNLKGNIQINTEVGRGTRFTLTLPLTLAIIDALMVQVGKDVYAIPLDAVSETTKIEAERLSEVNHRKALTLRGEVLGIIELSELLDLPSNAQNRDILPVVIIHDNDRRLGVVVDKLLERQEIVIKPLGPYLNGFEIRGISGATIMGDGSVVLILDPHEVYRLATASTKQGGHD